MNLLSLDIKSALGGIKNSRVFEIETQVAEEIAASFGMYLCNVSIYFVYSLLCMVRTY